MLNVTSLRTLCASACISVLVVSATTARAQEVEQRPADAPPAELPSPDAPSPSPAAAPTPPAPDEAAAAGPNRPELRAFLRSYIAYDVSTGTATEGQAQVPVPRDELFRRLGRPDLIDAASSRRVERAVLLSAAAVSVVAGAIGAFAIMADSPDVNSAWCTPTIYVRNNKEIIPKDAFKTYNEECVPRVRAHMIWSGVAGVGGLFLGAGLLTWAINLPIDGAPRSTIAGLVATYNGSLRQRLREPGSTEPTPGARLEVTPSVGLNGGSVTARLTF